MWPTEKLPHVHARLILWDWLPWRCLTTGLEGSSLGQRAAWVPARDLAGSSRALIQDWQQHDVLKLLPFIIYSLQTSVLAEATECSFYSGLHALLLVLSLALSNFLFISLTLSAQLRLSSFLFSLCICLSCLSLKNLMIHWLWSLRAVSLKSACLLSTTTERYITSITCNFLVL